MTPRRSLPLDVIRGVVDVTPTPAASVPASPREGVVAAAAMCRATMERLRDSKPAAVWPPPCPVLPALRRAYEGPAGSMPITSDMCFAQRYEGHNVLEWSESFIEEKMRGLAARTDPGTYSMFEVDQVSWVFEKYADIVQGAVGLVMGSEFPWVEALALNAGAATVWTFEYSTIVSSHPRLKAQHCQAIATDYLSGAFPAVDFIASFSSLEHSGLGRYGDELNPDGDLEALRQAWCMLRPGGVLALGVPMSCAPDGYIEYNAHRVYGLTRLAYIADDFEFLEFESGECRTFLQPDNPNFAPQAIAIFRKPISGVSAAAARREQPMVFPLGESRERLQRKAAASV